MLESRIKRLPREVVEKIAAGEVLERPANLVKELIENSIDAGATEIEIEFDLGGRDLSVSDNGRGISSEDLALSLERHTTSKIFEADDLWKLESYGFRGEALASIAAVSQLTITSKKSSEEKAFRVASRFGEVSGTIESGGAFGTQVRVTSLFENVPARLKFLKSDGAEGQQIKKVVKAMALSHPQVGFRLKSRGELLCYWPAKDTFLKRCESILGKKLFLAVDDGIEIAFSSPLDVEKTSQNLWFFVQDRFVQDRVIQAAVMDSYRTLLMHGEFPSVVVNLWVSPGEVDVNVHPTKSQIKFVKSSDIFRKVHGVLRSALEKAPWAPKTPSTVEIQHTSEPEQVSWVESPQFQNVYFAQKSENQFVSEPSKSYGANESTQPNQLVNKVETSPSKGVFWSHLQVLGQANLTYIVAQSRQSLFLVDQHASHERVAFEQLMSSWRQGRFEIQEYLLPLALTFDAEMTECLLETKSSLEVLGISIDQLGPESVSVRAAPALLKEKAIEHTLRQWAQEVQKAGESFAVEKKINDLLATMACHSVVRAGQALSNQEMKSLLDQMDEFPLSGYCPHGRPVYVEYSFQNLDKSFGRIV